MMILFIFWTEKLKKEMDLKVKVRMTFGGWIVGELELLSKN